MATWVTPIESQTDPDAPLTSELGKRWDNNVIAAFEGASGAPRLEDAALDTTVTTAGTTWVRNRTAAVTHGQIGTYAMAAYRDTPQVPVNFTTDGSNLEASNVDGNVSGVFLTGTWRNMGGFASQDDVSLWVRIS
jgi:hypothetical protein